MLVFARFLAMGAAASLPAIATAGSAGATAASIWQVVPSENPQPQQVTNSTFASVSMTSATDGWAVGQFMDKNAIGHPLAEHWDGSAFSRAAAPTPKGRQAGLAGVDELNPTANFVAHWNGTTWSVVPSPCLEGMNASACSGNSINLNELTGVTALSGSDAWASGSESNVKDMNFHIPYVLHWNGTAWSLVKTPNRGGEGSLLNGITALAADDVWAVGQTQSLNGAIKPLTERFNGSTWSLVPSPAPGSSGTLPDDSLAGVASPGGGLVFAVGARDIPGQCCLRTLGIKTTSG
jgi:hypothetical protein